MDIVYGAAVKDSGGKLLGTVNRVVRDSWTGEISKFSVASDLADADLFYAADDVAEASSSEVKLKVAFGEANRLGIQFGAKVLDSNGRLLGTVDYTVSDTLTGQVKKFKVSKGDAAGASIFSMEDVARATPSEVRLKIAVK